MIFPKNSDQISNNIFKKKLPDKMSLKLYQNVFFLKNLIFLTKINIFEKKEEEKNYAKQKKIYIFGSAQRAQRLQPKAAALRRN